MYIYCVSVSLTVTPTISATLYVKLDDKSGTAGLNLLAVMWLLDTDTD